ncbi:MAG: TonB-dependent receptor [Flavobacterium sp.]|uniref:TonB-dependent receptor n=1 Tax=Flavobacterium sp. TaxID=239 RepID=UPI0022BD6156|nr:TonB-dependent receptor [Flavobacterium sp.]MCZ8198613.1 TonB-dependent receptor [Flavobacterium sp.]
MKFKIQYIAFSLVFLATQFAFSQKKDENIGTEVVNVVKPYTPTISDAFKVKETPSLNDEETSKKEEIKYSIFSFPVASTFAPAKGKAAGVDKEAQEELFNSYATLGLGNYINALGELYVTKNIGDTDYFGGMFKHFSSQGGIKDLVLDDKFSTTSFDLTYGSKKQAYSWTADLGYELKNNFWYGLPSDFGNLFTEDEKAKVINTINEANSFSNISAGGNINFTNSMFNDVSVKFNHFSDKFKSSENRFLVKPTFEFDAAGTTIKTKLIVDYLGGSFKKDYSDLTSINYGYTNLGIHPSIAMSRNDWSFNLGAAAFYSIDNENKKNKFFVYPQINASIALVENIMIFYAGAEGTLQQNTYRDFVNENQFVSPTLLVAPTDKQFDVFGGLKGKVSNNLSYNVRGSVVSEKSKAFFVSNYYDDTIVEQQNYQYGNSFDVTYDDMKTISFFGELKADFTKNFSIGVNGTFNNYNMKNEEEAWNLPSIKLGANLDVNITPKWYAGANVFFVGDRKDAIDKINNPLVPNIVTLKSYFDANAHLGFKYTNRLTAFLKLNNIANQGYQKWLNYPVQSFQFMLGASYKFNL